MKFKFNSLNDYGSKISAFRSQSCQFPAMNSEKSKTQSRIKKFIFYLNHLFPVAIGTLPTSSSFALANATSASA